MCYSLFFTGEYTEIEFESYFVTVERIVKASNTTTDGPKAVISFKIPKFKPPSYTAPPQKLLVDQQDTESKNTHSIARSLSNLNVTVAADFFLNHRYLQFYCPLLSRQLNT